MKILFFSPSIYMSPQYNNMIYAPRDLSIHLVDGLVEKGHEVTFVTAPNIKTKARTIIGDQNYINFMNSIPSKDMTASQKSHLHFLTKRDYEVELITRAVSQTRDESWDVVHVYHITMMHYFEAFIGSPFIYTLHDPLPEKNTLGYLLFSKFKDHHYVSISNAQRKSSDLDLNYVATIYHGVDLRELVYQDKPSDYLLFMGRLIPEKGLHHAIEVALRLNRRLEIGTQLPTISENKTYYINKIKPYLDNPVIGKTGMVEGSNKTLLYKEARILLFPIEWEEPFGLVMIEAMACGTPVVAYAQGSVPEIIKDGVTGFIVNLSNEDKRGDWVIKKTGIEGLSEAVEKIYAMGESQYKLMRQNCRRLVEEKFTVEKMVENYEKVYQKILAARMRG